MIDLRSEARLETTSGFQARVQSSKPATVLLTGGTGFIGAFVLGELLASSDTTLYCLLRTDDVATGRHVLGRRLSDLQIEYQPAELDKRVIPVPGDLGRPNLGLGQSAFEDLAARIDTIIHIGAQVHFLKPYSALKPVNVDGTREIVRLAAQGRPKALHYLSSLAVFFGTDTKTTDCFCESDLPDPDRLRIGYQQSKWVGEHLVRQARQFGLTASIQRVGRVAGHSRTGVTGKLDDLFYRMLCACLRLGCYPDRDNPITLIPVDYLARVLVRLALDSQASGEDFHIVHQHPVPWNQLLEQVASLGWPMTKQDYNSWLERLGAVGRQEPGAEHLRTLHLALRMSNALFGPRPRFDDTNLRRRMAGSGIVCPPIDLSLMATYLDYLHRRGIV